MQNDEYYELYVKEWEKMLGRKEPTVTEEEKSALRKILNGLDDIKSVKQEALKKLNSDDIGACAQDISDGKKTDRGDADVC